MACFRAPVSLLVALLLGFLDPASAALPRLDPIRAGSRASINKPRDLRPEAEETVSLWNLTDSLIEKLASGSYMVPPRDDGQEEWLHTALRAAVAEEATRRSVEGFLGGRQSREDTNWGWWPWRRKHTKEHHPNPSNPNITFDLDSSLEAVQLAALSYCEPPKIISMNCTRCLQLPGLEPVVAVHDDSWNLQGYSGWMESMVTGEKEMVIAFRGTDALSLYNWVENLRATKTDFELPYPEAEGAKVHSGFFRSYNDSALHENMVAAVRQMMEEHPGAPLHIIGHSLGGALASICALEMRLVLGVEDVRVTTFGSPRVGNDKFHSLFDRVLKRTRRFTHNNDIVPSVPTVFMGFQHVATEFFVLDIKLDKLLPSLQVVVICDGSGEDPDCHAKECGFGLCTSIWNHLHYLETAINHCD